MLWEWLLMRAPLFNGDPVYNALLAGIVFLIGLALLMKAGSKWGLLVIAAGLGWAFWTFKELIYM